MRNARRSTIAALTLGLTISMLPVAGAAGASVASGRPAPPPELTMVYVYKKVNASAPASWENSGRQRLVQIRNGHSWTRNLDPSLLPDDVCGPGWAIQEDQTRGLARRDVPQVVDRKTGEGVLGWPPIVAARHRELSDVVAVPECTDTGGGQTPPPTTPPTSTPEPTQVVSEPTFEPEAPPAGGQVTPPVAAPAVPVPHAPTFTG